MWHVSSRSGVATLRAAIHLLLTVLWTTSFSVIGQAETVRAGLLLKVTRQRAAPDPGGGSLVSSIASMQVV